MSVFCVHLKYDLILRIQQRLQRFMSVFCVHLKYNLILRIQTEAATVYVCLLCISQI